MRRVVVILAFLGLVVLAAACSSSSDDSDTEALIAGLEERIEAAEGRATQAETRADVAEAQIASASDPTEVATATATVTATATPTAPATATPTDTAAALATSIPAPSSESLLAFAWDSRHGDDPNKTNAADLAEGKGWKIFRHLSHPILEDTLWRNSIDIFQIQGIEMAHTDAELDEIVSYVENGGTVLLGLNASRTVMERELLKRFSMDRSEVFISNLQVALPSETSHPLLLDVGRLDFRIAVQLTVSEPSYTLLQGGETEPYFPLIGVYESSAGGFFIATSQRLQIDLNDADNGVLLLNLLNLVAERSR